MLALLEYYNNITSLKTGHLVSLAVEHDLLAIFHALIDVNLEDLSLSHRFFAITRLANVLIGLEALALTLAVAALRVYLLVHASAELVDDHLGAGALACCALVNGAFLAAAALALVADHAFLQRQFLGHAVVEVFERNAQLVDDVFAALLAVASACATTASAEEHLEYVEWVREGAAVGQAAFFERLLATFVVDLALLFV